ncbi:MAG TPA: hypothetical protein VES40_01475 [Ilumatobacteraceae bacterium]|nr:hypothetical protein [Ilumatobacteraceae bacterium]
MQDTKELQASPAGIPGVDGYPPPPPVPSHFVRPPNQINQATPMLPQVPAAVPRPPIALEANQFATSMNDQWSPTPKPAPRKKSGSARRKFSWLIVLATIGGIAYAGYTYGSDLMKLTGNDSIDEPAVAREFPTPAKAIDPIRTATFLVERPDALQGPQTFEVTTDFETGVSRVIIQRNEGADLEMLTLWDTAFVRRVDEPTWYRLERGQFPIGSELGISRWIRSLDQVLPQPIRDLAVIDRATESSVGAEATTRLLVTIDPAAITLATAVPATPPPPADGTVAPPPPAPQATLSPGIVLQPGSDADETLSVELWIDDAGIVRKSIMPAELGAETITITSLSAEAWQPVFPTEDMVQSLTASSMFRLGI